MKKKKEKPASLQNYAQRKSSKQRTRRQKEKEKEGLLTIDARADNKRRKSANEHRHNATKPEFWMNVMWTDGGQTKAVNNKKKKTEREKQRVEKKKMESFGPWE